MSIVRTVDDAVDIFRVAAAYKLSWGEDTGRPQQVPCPMHNDSTPSARIYPDSNSGYCWTCQAPFGPCRLVAELEEVHIVRAAHMLADRYAVDLTPDADLAEFQRLAGSWAAGPDGNTPEARRAAGLAVRGPGKSWGEVCALLPLWDALDAGAIKPTDWLDVLRSMPSTSASPDVG